MISPDRIVDVQGVSFEYGVIPALIDVSMCAQKGEIVAIVGPNGAGKTTLLRAISGLVQPRKGSIKLLGKVTCQTSPWDIAGMGVAHVPQGRRCFGGLTVQDNLIVGGYRLSKDKAALQIEIVYDIFPILREKRLQLAAELSGGQQQMLAIGRAIMSAPDLLLLDEPSLGLSPKLVQELSTTLVQLTRRLSAAILLAEQNTRLALDTSERAYVMRGGRMLLDGPSSEIASEVKRLYFGQVEAKPTL